LTLKDGFFWPSAVLLQFCKYDESTLGNFCRKIDDFLQMMHFIIERSAFKMYGMMYLLEIIMSFE